MGNPNLKENPLKRALALPFRGFLKTFFPITYVKLQYKYITHHTLHLKKSRSLYGKITISPCIHLS